jgi:hypothetical protein
MFPSYIPRRLVLSCTLLCIYRAAEHTEQQSNRATEQPAGHMTCTLLSRAGSPTAGGDACACSAVVRLGVITPTCSSGTPQTGLSGTCGPGGTTRLNGLLTQSQTSTYDCAVQNVRIPGKPTSNSGGPPIGRSRRSSGASNQNGRILASIYLLSGDLVPSCLAGVREISIGTER